ncbi:MAG: CDP-alcohol phosphatidyltransferase family protein [Candidatus Aminicenantaceae bacterium]
MNHDTNPPDTRKATTGYIALQIMTLIRIPMAVIFGLILVFTNPSDLKLIACLALLGLIEASDLLDGVIARRYNLVSEYGAMLDPYADSITRLIVYFSMASHNLVLSLVPMAMALRDVTVAYARISLAKKNRTVSAKRSGKIKAMFQAIGAFVALLGPYYWDTIGSWSFLALSWVLITVTLLSAVEYVRAALRALSGKD